MQKEWQNKSGYMMILRGGPLDGQQSACTGDIFNPDERFLFMHPREGTRPPTGHIIECMYTYDSIDEESQLVVYIFEKYINGTYKRSGE